MKTSRQNLPRTFLFALCLICLVGVPACVTYQRATPEAPFVINFEFLKPFTATRMEERQFIAALEKYAIRSQTRIKVGKIVIWPPPIPSIDKMKTDRITKSEKASSGDESRGHPLKTDNANMKSSGDDKPTTDRPVKTDWGTNRPVKTDHISFATDQDLRDFVNCIAGKGCPDRKSPGSQ